MGRPQLVVMAAGIGRRYGGLKQIEGVGPSGEIVLDYSIYDAIRAGFGKVVFIIRREIEQAFREKVGSSLAGRIETEYVFQELDMLPAGSRVPAGREKPWGTGHALLCAKDAVSENFAAISADDFYGAESFRVLGEFLDRPDAGGNAGDYAMVGFVLANTLSEHGHVARGACTAGAGGYLTGIVERTRIQRFGQAVRYSEDGESWTDITGDTLVSMNMWGFSPSIFAELQGRFGKFLAKNADNPKVEFFLPTVVNDLMAEGKARVKVLPTTGQWLGVTYRQDKAGVQQAVAGLVADGVYPGNLWAR